PLFRPTPFLSELPASPPPCQSIPSPSFSHLFSVGNGPSPEGSAPPGSSEEQSGSPGGQPPAWIRSFFSITLQRILAFFVSDSALWRSRSNSCCWRRARSPARCRSALLLSARS